MYVKDKGRTFFYRNAFYIIFGITVAVGLGRSWIALKPEQTGTIAAASTSTERSPSSAVNGYCIALRGNGESEPAHWGALAQTFETYGAPAAMAGGSSASMTTFLWDSANLNPFLSTEKFQRGREMALLFKSLEGVTYHLYKKRKWGALVDWVKQAQKDGRFDAIFALQNSSTLLTQLAAASTAINDLKTSGIFFGPSVRAVAKSLMDPAISTDKEKQNRLNLQIDALKRTYAVMGKFDAKNDTQLFVRDGIVDFRALALRFGALGDYLAQRGASNEAKQTMKTFLTSCLQDSDGSTWLELVKKNASCQGHLVNAVDAFFDNYEFTQTNRIHDSVGSSSHVLVTTSVVAERRPGLNDKISEDSAFRYRKIRQNYLSTLDPSIGGDVTVDPQDLFFGFWGQAQDLEAVQQSFANTNNPLSHLDKSKRFLPLGKADWLQVLSLSPAEPGLSPALEFSSVGLEPRYISFGGWSDLHPIPVLKAMGCDSVVYVTRRGGDSLFGMGVVKRLLQFEKPEWALLDSFEKETHKSQLLNNNGSDEYRESKWHDLYNLKNPQSSFAGSLAAADAVVCTDWNAYDVKKDFPALVATSYHTPIYEATRLARSPLTRAAFITKDDNGLDAEKGFPPYAGCIPLQ